MQRRSSSPNGSTRLGAAWAVAADAANGAQTHDCCKTGLALSISTRPAPIDMVAPCGSANKGVSVQRITPRLIDAFD
jgi:hypothetical protein